MRFSWKNWLPRTLIRVAAVVAGQPSRGGEQSFAQVRHGKTLIDAGDCVACHTTANGKPFAEGQPVATPFGTIYSPNLTPDRDTGIGRWSDEDFYNAMHTGVAPDGSRLFYLKALGPASQASQTAVDQTNNGLGKTIYTSSCSACHGSDGFGQSHMFPPLAKNANVKSVDPSTIIRIVLQGVRTATTDRRPTPSAMPAYDWKPGHEEVAAVVSFVRNSRGNAAATLAASDAKDLRRTLHASTP